MCLDCHGRFCVRTPPLISEMFKRTYSGKLVSEGRATRLVAYRNVHQPQAPLMELESLSGISQ